MIALLGLAAPAALAAQLQLTVDDNEVAVGDVVQVQLQVVDGQLRGVPELPSDRGLQVRFRGQSQSTVVVNFETTRLVRYSFEAVAVAPGRWTLGPVDVVVDGEPLSAGPVSIEVREEPAGDDEPASVEGSLSATEPWEGQLLVHRLRFTHKEEVGNLRWTPPETPGLIAEPGVEGVQREGAEVIEGVRQGFVEILTPLRAAAAGAGTASPAVVSADMAEAADPRTGRRRVDLFGRARAVTRRFATRPIPYVVRPLPVEGRQTDFSGIVGQVEVSSSLSADRAALGDSLTWTVEVLSTGALTDLRLPPVPADAGLRVYDDAPELRVEVLPEGVRTRAILRRALVPEREGALTVPAIELAHFDPATGAYARAAAAALRLEVLPGDGGGELASFGGPAPTAGGVEALGEDILPAPGGAEISDHRLSAAWGWLLGPPGLAGLGLAAVGVRGRLRRRGDDPWDSLRAELRGAPAEGPEALAAWDRGLRGAVGLRLGVAPPLVDRAAVARLGDGAAALWADLEAARYGGRPAGDLGRRVAAFVERRGLA